MSLVWMVLSLVLNSRAPEPEAFVPPPFEAAAEAGIPEAADPSWTQIYRDGMSFSSHVCGKVRLKEDSADLFFTNDSGNEVWLKLRVLDEKDRILAETGLLKPDTYVKTVHFTKVPKNGEKIKLKIMAYEPDTYYSAGAVTLNTVAGG